MIDHVVILGAGSAGLLAALTLKTKLPRLNIEVLGSTEIGIIGVGEGTTPAVTKHLHQYLQQDPADFHRLAQPTWKIGLRLIWGQRPFFNYSFGPQTVRRYNKLPRFNGFYCDEDFSAGEPVTAMMDAGKTFPIGPDGEPHFGDFVAYHIENEHFVRWLESRCRHLGATISDETVEAVDMDDTGIRELSLRSGRKINADLFVDASGFRSELIGKAFQTPFLSFDKSLYCDRAVVGGWDRSADEPILPYTTAETMNSGWCWRIEHEHRVIRGYVYSSAFISDDAARDELLRVAPKIADTRIVKFTSGYYRDSWVKNVVGIGNACGFVEPIEATALMVICDECRFLADALLLSDCKPTPTIIATHNRVMQREWESIRGFLAIHYRFNKRLETPFWQACRSDVELGRAQDFVEFYQDNGPLVMREDVVLDRNDIFGLEGHLTLMLGQQVPYRNRPDITPAEWSAWRAIQAECRGIADKAITAEDAAARIRSGRWRWQLNLPA